MKRSKDHPNNATNGDTRIVLYDNAFEEPEKIPQLLAHELAHLYFQSMTPVQQDQYRRQADWFEYTDLFTKKTTLYRRPKGYVLEDGKTSLQEDFANNVEYFLFHNHRLKEVTPSVHLWFQLFFGDTFRMAK